MPMVDIEETTWLALFLAPLMAGGIDEVKPAVTRSLNRC